MQDKFIASLDLISVIIPVYNAESKIKRCIDSVVSQTYTCLQIILIDDGSTDDSLKICKDYEQVDERIIVIKQENGGVGKARNTGLNRATGMYICFVDADDYLLKDCIETLYIDLISNECDISACNHYCESRGRRKTHKELSSIYSSTDAIKMMWHNRIIPVASWAKLFKEQLWNNVRFPECYAGEDYATIYKSFLNAQKIFYNGCPKYIYCYDKNSISNSFLEKKIELLYVAERVVADCSKHYEFLETSAKTKGVDIAFQCLCQMNEKLYKKYSKRVLGVIYKYRRVVFVDRDVRVKSLVAVLLSYINPMIVRKLYRIRWRDDANC